MNGIYSGDLKGALKSLEALVHFFAHNEKVLNQLDLIVLPIEILASSG